MSKIIGVYKDKSGGAYHRVKLPLSFMGAELVEVNNLNEKILKDCTTLWMHGNYNKPYQISNWRIRCGFQLVYEIDDSWGIPRNHPNYEAMKSWIRNSQELCMIADVVVVTNELVRKQVLEFCDNVIVVPNLIPYNYAQFHVIPEDKDSFMKRKIRVGFCGSNSHAPDYISLALRLKRLKDHPNIEWVLAGVAEDTVSWKTFKSMGWKLIPPRDTNDYIELYRELDIILCPLDDNELNRARSPLKIYESACTNTTPILGSLYKDKLHGIPPDLIHFDRWNDTILDLVRDREKLWYHKTEVSKMIRDSVDYEKECVLPRQQILGMKRPEVNLPNIYGITYGDNYTEYIPYHNHINTVEQKSYFFEHNVVKKLWKTT